MFVCVCVFPYLCIVENCVKPKDLIKVRRLVSEQLKSHTSERKRGEIQFLLPTSCVWPSLSHASCSLSCLSCFRVIFWLY